MTHNPWEFIKAHKTLNIASTDKNHTPHISYAPFIENDKKFYICISGMAQHTKNLIQVAQCSIMIIEDEAQSQNLFAKRRVTFDTNVAVIARDSSTFTQMMKQFREKFGESTSIYENMPDFQLFELTPKSGRAVFGFGEAYNFTEGSFSDKPMGMMR